MLFNRLLGNLGKGFKGQRGRIPPLSLGGSAKRSSTMEQPIVSLSSFKETIQYYRRELHKANVRLQKADVRLEKSLEANTNTHQYLNEAYKRSEMALVDLMRSRDDLSNERWWQLFPLRKLVVRTNFYI